MTEEQDRSKIGWLSLWASISGIVTPVVLAWFVRTFAKGNDEPYYMLCCLFFAGAELVALVTGIIGRRSVSGKAGLWISAVCLAVTVLAVLWMTPVRVVRSGPSNQIERSQHPPTN